MCGIGGMVGELTAEDLRRVPSASLRLQHRGPDDYGYLLYRNGKAQSMQEWAPAACNAELVLIHRRLSILDLSKSGWQPMSAADGRLHIVYNGEIYNYLELRSELEQLGHQFRSRTDTEVLLAAYRQWGMQALQRFVGMFAFALLDCDRELLLLARDFFGIKPLYYTSSNKALAFASEIKALLQLRRGGMQVNPERAYVYLRYGICDDGPQTMLADIKQLPAGHYLEVPLSAPSETNLTCYWRPQFDAQLDISFPEAASRLRELFLKNVQLHLRSDVRVGAALSGGIDSSAIVAGMRHVSAHQELHAFSYIAEDNAINEERWIDLAAKMSGAELHKVRPGANDLLEDVEALAYAQDQPFGGTSLYAQYCVFRAAHQVGIKVMLDGQGADEILGGYRFYLAARFVSLLRQRRFSEAARFLGQCSRWPGVGKGWLFLRAMDYMLPISLQEPLRKVIGKDLAPDWLNREWFRQRGVSTISLNHSHTPDALREDLCRTLVQGTLPGLLRYEDRNSMAFSVESRVPFLTPELVNFMLSLPEQYIIAPNGTSKAVFREAMRGLVPAAILERRDKIGFATPEQHWLRKLQPWVQKSLESEVAAAIPCLNLRSARAEWDGILAGRRQFTAYVWRWLNLVQWTQRFQAQWT